MNLNFQKYKRIFAFGCSFTGYAWPTWADLISFENTNAEYYNYGKAGMGNVGIACRISEANNTYSFNENDLVMVMWSTYCREDRWIDGKWLSLGNVYNSEYTEEWLKKYADPFGYLVRDHAIINMANTFIKSLPCDNLILRSVPLTYTEVNFDVAEEQNIKLKTTYKNYDDLPKPLYVYLNGWDSVKQTSFLDDSTTKSFLRHDNHPRTTDYRDYLLHLGIELSPTVIDLADSADEILDKSTKRSELNKSFTYLRLRLSENFKQLF